MPFMPDRMQEGCWTNGKAQDQSECKLALYERKAAVTDDGFICRFVRQCVTMRIGGASCEEKRSAQQAKDSRRGSHSCWRKKRRLLLTRQEAGDDAANE